MPQDQFAVIIVYSTSHALRLEKLLQEKGISCKLIPVPRQISSDCGVCIRIFQPDAPAAKQAIDTAQLEVVGIHEL